MIFHVKYFSYNYIVNQLKSNLAKLILACIGHFTNKLVCRQIHVFTKKVPLRRRVIRCKINPMFLLSVAPLVDGDTFPF